MEIIQLTIAELVANGPYIAGQIICFFHQNIALSDTSNKFGTDNPLGPLNTKTTLAKLKSNMAAIFSRLPPLSEKSLSKNELGGHEGTKSCKYALFMFLIKTKI